VSENTGKIEMAFRIPRHEHIDVWVSLEDAFALASDEFLYGNMYVLRIADPSPNSLVTHRRVPPTEASL
jgi:hypothetical protein